MKDSDNISLIIIGGAEDKNGHKEILKKVAENVESKGKLVIATVATESPKEVGEIYKNLFQNLGLVNISILNIENRQDGYSIDNVNMIEHASLIFFTGGDQLRITSMLGGTPLYQKLLENHANGGIIVGTSAGASVMSDTMIIQGPDDDSPKKCTLKMAPGLGVINGVLIDQHFAQRGRLGRLMVGVAENPQSLGIGIDEDTAIVVNRSGEFQVIGSGAVYIIDGSTISKSNVSEQYPNEILSIFNIKLHVLKAGNTFDLKNRIPY
ncbi:cyanophycinase [Clostridium sp. 19966]|uniref:cyanophycinase n=1 Tax=Clostridium sp. 19966 TaxID=2768166 RepID=UPI0028DDCC72|nr:cyanophycinase [Clostridium sp. 19966]MDT8715617.1 cyanophycinase [Clostridium sp. 19966]